MPFVGLEYPCAFPIKVFLRPDPLQEEALIQAVQAQLDASASLEVERRNSSNGRYLCLTLRFNASSAEHAKRVAAVVRSADGVLMAL
ncbi:MAG: DUF493 domain-containing protein [Alcaligenaceae bacterium]|nr:DUF493 domain-containing protein [Alcaligenaceae bacterium]